MNNLFKNIVSHRFGINYLLLKPFNLILLILSLLVLDSCIVQFIPDTGSDQSFLVVEGLLTDQHYPGTIKLSTSKPLGGEATAEPLRGCTVFITDDLGNRYGAYEWPAGSYTTSWDFYGIVGRTYTLHINTNNSFHNLTYQSSPVLMKAVPPIDSIYYKKVVTEKLFDGSPAVEACQIYLDTHDPENSCRFYRWEFSETWEFSLPYNVPNYHCWVSDNSDKINIKSTSSLAEDRVVKFPLHFITNQSDRLKERYSILVNQYSLSDEEYVYWEKLQNVTEQVGSLYDIIPSSIPSNIMCIERPDEKVLGYFSVSAVSSKRIFIKDFFRGIVNQYSNCENKTTSPDEFIPDLNISIWLIINSSITFPYKVYTYFKGCADCTVRGTNQEPYFWKDGK